MTKAIAIAITILSFFSARSQAPSFDWVKGFGGPTGDQGYSIVTDAVHNIYVMGNFWLTVDMDPGPGVFNMTSAGQGDIFISKFDSSGNFIWAKQIGNNFDDVARKMNIDNNGNLYLTGHFYATVDFDPGPAVFNLTCNTSSYEAFLLKLDSDGNFVWAKKITDADYGSSGWAVSAAPSGNVYVAGSFRGTGDFDPGSAVFIMSSTPNADDIFISKFDPILFSVW